MVNDFTFILKEPIFSIQAILQRFQISLSVRLQIDCPKHATNYKIRFEQGPNLSFKMTISKSRKIKFLRTMGLY